MNPTTFAFTGAQFDSLAIGYGTPDAIAILRDGQLTKRKRLLQPILQTSSPAVDLLLSAEQTATEVLRHPHLDAWATQALRTPGDLGYLAQLAAAAAIRAGLSFTIDVPTTNGQVYLPTLGAATVGGSHATVTGSADGEVRIGAVRRGGDGWEPTRVVQLEPGFTLAIEDQEPYRDTYQWRPMPRLDAGTAERFAALLRAAWLILVRRHPEHAEAMRGLLRVVVPLIAPGSGGNVSATSRNASGSVAVAIPASAEELCLLLLHEFMHMKLEAVRDLIDLHVDGGDGRFRAPWRMDPRPVGPLFQGVYAHTGVTDYWRKRRATDARAVVALEFAYWRLQSATAAQSLADSGELTPEGVRFVGHLGRTLDQWANESVPPALAGKAAAMVLAQNTRWKLRNWRPSAAELARTADPAPAGVLRTDAGGEPSGLPGLVGMIRASVTGEVPGDPAAAHLIGGRYEKACSSYLERVLADPTDEDAWIGLTLATRDPGLALALRERPDLVREMLSADRRADLTELADQLRKRP